LKKAISKNVKMGNGEREFKSFSVVGLPDFVGTYLYFSWVFLGIFLIRIIQGLSSDTPNP
jgi:hypothetical protein